MLAVLKYVVIKPIILAPFLGNWLDISSSLYPNSYASTQMLPPLYEVYTIAQDCVMAHFSCTLLAAWLSG